MNPQMSSTSSDISLGLITLSIYKSLQVFIYKTDTRPWLADCDLQQQQQQQQQQS